MCLNYRTGEFLPILDSEDLDKELNTETYIKSKDSIGDGISGDVLGARKMKTCFQQRRTLDGDGC
jgi:hypothetical protein